MNTFLPYASFTLSATCLDDRRLNNQINEALIIWRTLTGYYPPGRGWPHHSATRMWRGYEDALARYHNACLIEYCQRNGSINERLPIAEHANAPDPPWLGDPALHASHRSNLLRKDPQWYEQFGWREADNLAYVWPA